MNSKTTVKSKSQKLNATLVKSNLLKTSTKSALATKRHAQSASSQLCRIKIMKQKTSRITLIPWRSSTTLLKRQALQFTTHGSTLLVITKCWSSSQLTCFRFQLWCSTTPTKNCKRTWLASLKSTQFQTTNNDTWEEDCQHSRPRCIPSSKWPPLTAKNHLI